MQYGIQRLPLKTIFKMLFLCYQSGQGLKVIIYQVIETEVLMNVLLNSMVDFSQTNYLWTYVLCHRNTWEIDLFDVFRTLGKRGALLPDKVPKIKENYRVYLIEGFNS